VSRKPAMSVRPSPQKPVNWGGGQRRCRCCGVSMCDDAVLPAVPDGGVCGPAGPEVVREVEIEAPVEEARTRKDIPRPYAPTQEEIAKHRVDHLPYRNWCPECVEGFARERAHHAHAGSDRETPLVSCDYLYITPGECLPGMSSQRASAMLRALFLWSNAQ
jgi:hypothetical protein